MMVHWFFMTVVVASYTARTANRALAKIRLRTGTQARTHLNAQTHAHVCTL